MRHTSLGAKMALKGKTQALVQQWIPDIPLLLRDPAQDIRGYPAGYPVTVAGSRKSFPCWIPDIHGYPAGYPVTVAGSRAGAFFPDSYYNIKFSRGTRISRPPAPSSLARILGGGRIPSPSERFCPGLRPSGVPSPDAGSDTLPFRKILSGPATIRGPVP